MCDGTIGQEVVKTDIVVPSGASCILDATEARRSVVVEEGGGLWAKGASIRLDLRSGGAAGIAVGGGATIGGRATITGTTGVPNAIGFDTNFSAPRRSRTTCW